MVHLGIAVSPRFLLGCCDAVSRKNYDARNIVHSCVTKVPGLHKVARKNKSDLCCPSPNIRYRTFPIDPIFLFPFPDPDLIEDIELHPKLQIRTP